MALSDNLVSYWKFDESSGNASDSVGGVTLTNANVTYSATNARINNGAVFNGSSSKFTASSNTSLDLSTISWSLWVYRTNTTSFFQIWSKSTGNGITLRINQTTNVVVIEKQGVGTLATSTGTIGATTLTHLVATWDNSTGAYTFYINGSSAGSGTGTAQTFTWGGDRIIGNDGGLWADGTMDEFGVWSRVLTGAEVTELYNAGAGKQYPFGTAYSMVYALGTYTYTGFDIAFTKALNMIYALGTYTYTGFDMLFSLGKGIVFETGSYIYTGFDIGLTKALTMVYALGTYTYTGFDFVLTKGMNLVMNTGTYVYTGFNMILRRSGWRNTTKESTTWTDQSKASTNWTNIDKSI